MSGKPLALIGQVVFSADAEVPGIIGNFFAQTVNTVIIEPSAESPDLCAPLPKNGKSVKFWGSGETV